MAVSMVGYTVLLCRSVSYLCLDDRYTLGVFLGITSTRSPLNWSSRKSRPTKTHPLATHLLPRTSKILAYDSTLISWPYTLCCHQLKKVNIPLSERRLGNT